MAQEDGKEGTAYDGLHCKALHKRGTLFRLQVYERVGISLVEVHDKVEKSLILVCKRVQKG